MARRLEAVGHSGPGFRVFGGAYQDALAQELQSLEMARVERSAGEQVDSKLKQTMPSCAQTAQAYETLQKEGFVGEVAAKEKRRDRVEKSQALKAQESMLASVQASIAQSGKKLTSLRSNYQSQLENERVET